MSDEISSKNETLPPYEPQPRGNARIPGVDPDAIDKDLLNAPNIFSSTAMKQTIEISNGISGECSFDLQ